MTVSLEELTLSLNESDEGVTQKLKAEGVGGELKSLLVHHQLYVPVAQRHAEAFRKDSFGPYFRRELRQRAVRDQLEKLLKDEGIDFRWLKGASLAEKLFDFPVARYSGDVDILVRPADFGRVCALLLAREWRYHGGGHVPEPGSFTKDVLLISPEGVRLEVHHRLAITPGKVHDAYEQWLWQSDPTSGGLATIELLYLCQHGAATAFHRLKWLYDIALYFQKLHEMSGMNLEAFAMSVYEEACKYDGQRAFLVSCLLCERFFGCRVPEGMLALYQNDLSTQWIVAVVRRYADKPERMAGWRYRIVRRLCALRLEESLPRKLLLFREYLRNGIRNQAVQA